MAIIAYCPDKFPYLIRKQILRSFVCLGAILGVARIAPTCLICDFLVIAVWPFSGQGSTYSGTQVLG